MNTRISSARLLVLLLAAAGPALAGPPPWAGGGHKGGGEEHGRKGGGKQEVVVVKQGAYFNDRQRDSVHGYYASKCPPGLAKKNNGCMPPGQARKVWAVGQPLPSTVVLAPVPQQIVVTLPPPPVGHRYVQVTGDILLIALGSKMVVDGIHGLTR
jgi:hypothetical protein